MKNVLISFIAYLGNNPDSIDTKNFFIGNVEMSLEVFEEIDKWDALSVAIANQINKINKTNLDSESFVCANHVSILNIIK